MMLEDYCVIDLEMTGLNPKHHKILEVAAVRVRKKAVSYTHLTLPTTSRV